MSAMNDDEALAASRVGTTIANRWTVRRVLGYGGMATVFLAEDVHGGRVAIKLLHPETNAVPELRKRFLREGPIGNALADGSGVGGFVRVVASGEDIDGTAYLAMEALEGDSVQSLMTTRGTLPVGEVLSIADQVLEVLAVAHQRGIVHRDLKPENLHVEPSGRVRVLDFGIARVVDAVHEGVNIPEKTATATGVIIGTAAFMAPEQALGLREEIDARTDLYSLGATLFRLLTGRNVHPELKLTQQIIAAATQPAEPIAEVTPGLPAPVCRLVDRALGFKKHQRYSSAAEMRADVHLAMAAVGSAAPLAGFAIAPTDPDPAPPAPGGPSELEAPNSPWLLPVFVGVGAVAIGVVITIVLLWA